VSVDKDALRICITAPSFEEAFAAAVEQVQNEADNKLRMLSPSDMKACEEALRAQGSVRGAIRVLELMKEMAGSENG
jgi:electron transfer flavoprotein alpha/beta subunit